MCSVNIADIYNCVLCGNNSSRIYQSVSVSQSYKVFYCKNIKKSSDISFSSNCIGCRFCIACDNLENQSYRIRNVAHTKEEYAEKAPEALKELLADQYGNYAKLKIHNTLCEDSGGYGLFNCRKVGFSVFAQNISL